MGFLTGKKALITGLLSKHSIAYGIAEAMHREGAELAFTYVNDKLKPRVERMIKDFNSTILLPCDVTEDSQIENLFTELGKEWDGLDILVHSIAFAPGDQLEGDYLENINREGFKIAHDISSYSLSAMAKAAYPLMEGRPASIITLSYLGAVRTITNYNVMGVAKASLEANMRYLAASLGPKGIRVNAISAGPIKTLAASGIKNFRRMLDYNAAVTPLRRNVTTEEVGNAAAFLASDLASGITGDVMYVDNGYHSIGIGMIEEPLTETA